MTEGQEVQLPLHHPSLPMSLFLAPFFTPSCLLIHPLDNFTRGFFGPHVLSLVTSQTALLY